MKNIILTIIIAFLSDSNAFDWITEGEDQIK